MKNTNVIIIIGLLLVFGPVNPLLSVLSGGESYAVLITGDTPDGDGEPPPPTSRMSPDYWNSFWNDTYLVWEMLYELGFKDENIFVLYGDGSDYPTENPRYDVDVRHNEISEVTDYSAYETDVEDIFTWLAYGDAGEGITRVTEDDFLFVWTFGHGESAGNDNPR